MIFFIICPSRETAGCQTPPVPPAVSMCLNRAQVVALRDLSSGSVAAVCVLAAGHGWLFGGPKSCHL